ARSYEVMLRLTSAPAARKVVAALKAWLQKGELTSGGVQLHTVNEVPSPRRVVVNDTAAVDFDTSSEGPPTSLGGFELTAGSASDEAHAVAKQVNPILTNLGATIRALRAQRKLSQEALADLAAIDRSYMSGIERGRRNISVLHAARIAAALKI